MDLREGIRIKGGKEERSGSNSNTTNV